MDELSSSHSNLQFSCIYFQKNWYPSEILFPGRMTFMQMPEKVKQSRTTNLTSTCSKSKIKTLKKGVKSVQSQQWKHQNNVNVVILVFLLLTLNIFHIFSSASIVDFEHANVSWEAMILHVDNNTSGKLVTSLTKYFWSKLAILGAWISLGLIQISL